MGMYVPEAARLSTCLAFQTGYNLSAIYMRLLSSRVGQADTVTLAMCLAAEASFAGYAPAVCSNFTAPTVSSGQPAVFFFTCTFNPSSISGTGSIFGTFFTGPGGTGFYGAEDFGPVPTSTPGTEPFVVTVQFFQGPG